MPQQNVYVNPGGLSLVLSLPIQVNLYTLPGLPLFEEGSTWIREANFWHHIQSRYFSLSFFWKMWEGKKKLLIANLEC